MATSSGFELELNKLNIRRNVLGPGSFRHSHRVAWGIESIKMFLEGYAEAGLTPENQQCLEVTKPLRASRSQVRLGFIG